MNTRLSKERGSRRLFYRERLKRVLAYAQELAGLGNCVGTLEIIITSPDTMEQMNGAFLQHEGCTDVLTFDLRENAMPPENSDEIVAEVYVCPEIAVEYSAKFKTTPSWELVLYMVHGMLHLAGEDDLEEEARRSMRMAEKRVMSALKERYSLEGFIK